MMDYVPRATNATTYGGRQLGSSGLTPRKAQFDREHGDRLGSAASQLEKKRSNARLRSAIESRMTTGDSRDTGKASALTSAGATTSDFSAPSFTAGPSSHPPPFSSSSPSSPSRPQHPSLPPVPRLPQSRFSFEYQYPLHKRALTAHLNPDNNNNNNTPASNSTDTPKRTFLYDRPRRLVPDFNFSHAQYPTASQSAQLSPTRLTTVKDSDAAPSLDTDPALRVLSPNATKRRKQSLYSQQEPPDVKRRMPSSTATFAQARTQLDGHNRPVKGVDRHGRDEGFQASITDDPRLKNEDIFLNIARSDSGRRESLGRSELRRSRFRMSGNGFRSSTSRVSDQIQTSSPDQLRPNSYDSPLHSQNGSPSAPYNSAPYSYAASAHPLDENGRSPQSNFTASARSVIGLPRSRLNRASPEDDSNPERRSSLHDSRSFRHSTLSTIRSSRQASGSEATERPRYEPDRSRQDGTESTLSTTAPSTVWDELEDLKSRIKKLELTGKLPPSSQEAITSASAERPRTATTTMTTLSSSPRHRRTSISGESDTITVPSPIHPLLQSALAKAKNVVGKEVYTALETTATDAFVLSGLLGSAKTPSGNVSVANGCSSIDRQARRKADSVCRSLTELCLALSDDQLLKQQASASGAALRMSQTGTDEGTITPTLTYRQSLSQEPEEIPRRQSGTRIASRLETRRSSLVNSNDQPSPDNSPYNKYNDIHKDPTNVQLPASPATASRLSRLSMSLRTKRLHTDEEASEHRSSHSRSISRSMTDIGSASSAQQRPTGRQRTGHGYTTSQLAPDSQYSQASQPRTPTTSSSGIPLRRSFMTPSLYTPATSRSNIQAGSRRYGISSTVEGAIDDTPPSPRTQVSQTKIIAPSSKLASSYTPISQNRLRTNSLGARRLGIRQRQMSAVDNGKPLEDSID